LNKKQIIETLKAFHAETKVSRVEMLIGAGSALCLYGLREETSDIDGALPRHWFEKFVREGKPTHEFKIHGTSVPVCEWSEVIDLHILAAGALNKTSWVEGIQVETLEGILAHKESMKRSKDQEDIRRIKERLGIKS